MMNGFKECIIMSIKYHYGFTRKPALKAYVLTVSTVGHPGRIKNVFKRKYGCDYSINVYIQKTSLTLSMKTYGFDLFLSHA